MAVLYFTGFETGDASELSSLGAGFSIDSAVKQSGSYALKGEGDYAELLAVVGLSLASVWARMYIRPSGVPASPAGAPGGIVLRHATDAEVYTSIATASGTGARTIQLVHRTGGGDVNLGSAWPIALNEWTRLEVKCVISTTVGIAEMALNGVVVETHTGLNTGSAPIVSLSCAMGNDVVGVANIVHHFDDIQVNDAAYPGSGRIIGRQVKAGTPTYNAWTKTGGATIDGVWSETPYSAALNAVSAGASQAQTGLVVDVAAGLNPIDVNDTINACRVMCVANRESAGSAYSAYSLRRRVSAADTDEAMSFASLDADLFHQGSIFTATRTALQSAEMGAVVGTGGGGREDLTIHDIWLMVDYTPAPKPKAIIVPQAAHRASYF